MEIEIQKKRALRSNIWLMHAFERLENGYKARCRICGKFLKMPRRSLRALITHLNVHLKYKKWYEQLERQKHGGDHGHGGDGDASSETSPLSSNENPMSHEDQLNDEINAYINEELLAERDKLAKYAAELYQLISEMLVYTFVPNLPKMPNSPKLYSLLMEAQNSGNSAVGTYVANNAPNAGFDLVEGATMEMDEFAYIDEWFQAFGIKEMGP